MNNYNCANLRKVYYTTLEELGSPIANVEWDDLPSFDQGLFERVVCFLGDAVGYPPRREHVESVELHAENVIVDQDEESQEPSSFANIEDGALLLDRVDQEVYAGD